MGVDFLKTKCKPFEKGLDRERVNNARGRLVGGPSNTSVTKIVAKTLGQNSLHEGDRVLVRAEKDRLTVLVDLMPTAVLVDPSSPVLSAIRETGGYAHGKIEAAHPTLELVTVKIE